MTRVFLVGFMAAGKSSVGRVLAARLGWTFADTDALVERGEGLSVEEIFRQRGEGRFREAESAALASLGAVEHVVVAAGGGLFLGVENRRAVRTLGRSVWLDVSLGLARARTGGGAGRPLWSEDPLRLRAMFEKRRAAYALADARVDASDGHPEAIAARILAIPRVFPPEFTHSR